MPKTTTEEAPVSTAETEQPSPEAQVASEPEAAKPPEGEETPKAPAEEVKPEADAELDRQVAAAMATEFGEVAEPEPLTEEEKLTLSKSELEERLRRERQSAQDRARYEADTERQQTEQTARFRSAQAQAMRGEIAAEAKRIADAGGEIPSDFADRVAGGYRGLFGQEGKEEASRVFAGAMHAAVMRHPAMQGATAEDWELASRPTRETPDYFTNYIDVVLASAKRQWEAEVPKRIEAEVKKQVKPRTEAALKRMLQGLRAAQPEGEALEGVGGIPKAPTDADIAAHRNDPVGPDGMSDWWRANREAYFAQAKTR